MSNIMSFQEILQLIADVRNQRNGFITNFYPDEFKVNIWLKHGQLQVLQQDDAVLFVIKSNGFAALYFAASSLASLQPLMDSLPAGCYVLDYVSRGEDVKMQEFMSANGFEKHSALYRMSRIAGDDSEEYVSDSQLRNACINDIPQIQQYFNTYFDKYVEQIPTIEELEQWISSGHIIVYGANGSVEGFLIYDSAPSSWYLRYWFVSPEYRERKVGSALIKEGMHRGKDAKRQMFWVIETNENAIKRYEHYGYNKEKMTDTIFIRKDVMHLQNRGG